MGEFFFNKLEKCNELFSAKYPITKTFFLDKMYWFQLSMPLHYVKGPKIEIRMILRLVEIKNHQRETEKWMLNCEHSTPNILEIASQRSMNWRIPRNSLTWEVKCFVCWVGYGQNHWMASCKGCWISLESILRNPFKWYTIICSTMWSL